MTEGHEDKEKNETEFGQGLCYNLGLFLAHADRIKGDKAMWEKAGLPHRIYEMWFYAAGDHLYNFCWELAPTKELQERCKAFQRQVLTFRLPMDDKIKVTKKEYDWAISTAKELLMLIDKAHGIHSKKAKWD